MKKVDLLYLISIVIILFSSCTSTKEIQMFQDSYDTLNKYHIPPKAPEHKIRPFDNLYLSVLTMDPEVNALFNPSSQGDGFSSSTTQMYGAPIGKEINGYRVSQEGTITVPMLGKIALAGLSLEEAEIQLKEKAEEFLIDPHIQIKFLNYRVHILGEVRFPGIYYNYEGKVSILEAIGMANGISDFSDIKNTIVKRHDGNKVVTLEVDLTDSSVYSSDAFYLQPNDLVYIPPSKLKRRQVNVQTYSMVLSTISVLLVSVTLITNL